MIKVIAACYKDGLACVFDGTSLIIIRPPYASKGSPIKPEDVTKAVSHQGFSAVDEEFKSFEELYGFLREQNLKGEWEKKISRE
jgi:hypothetical protein